MSWALGIKLRRQNQAPCEVGNLVSKSGTRQNTEGLEPVPRDSKEAKRTGLRWHVVSRDLHACARKN